MAKFLHTLKGVTIIQPNFTTKYAHQNCLKFTMIELSCSLKTVEDARIVVEQKGLVAIVAVPLEETKPYK